VNPKPGLSIFQRNMPPMLFYHGFDQAEPQTVTVGGAACIATVEMFKDLLFLMIRYALTMIGNHNIYPFTLRCCKNLDDGLIG